jgi:hypothetical protein
MNVGVVRQVAWTGVEAPWCRRPIDWSEMIQGRFCEAARWQDHSRARRVDAESDRKKRPRGLSIWLLARLRCVPLYLTLVSLPGVTHRVTVTRRGAIAVFSSFCEWLVSIVAQVCRRKNASRHQISGRPLLSGIVLFDGALNLLREHGKLPPNGRARWRRIPSGSLRAYQESASFRPSHGQSQQRLFGRGVATSQDHHPRACASEPW